MSEFPTIDRLPPYIFGVLDSAKNELVASGEQLIDLGMGNPDQPTPKPIVEALCHAAKQTGTNRYSAPRGILPLRKAISQWYEKRFNVNLDPESETIVTIGSKEGLSHLALAITAPGDSIIVPTPAYPIHTYGFVIAGANVAHVPLDSKPNFFSALETAMKTSSPTPKVLLLNFPANPSTMCVDVDFFTEVIKIAKANNIWVVHDFAYADLGFDGYRPPSILQVPGAKECAVESYSLSKTYNMPGWRVGFMVGNETLINALARIKSYVDYGLYEPIQYAAQVALEQCDSHVEKIRQMYQARRDALCDSLAQYAGWEVEKPRSTMFVWAKIPTEFREMGSLEFCRFLLKEAKVVVSPGIGFGGCSDDYVRMSLIQDEATLKAAAQAIGEALGYDRLRELRTTIA